VLELQPVISGDGSVIIIVLRTRTLQHVPAFDQINL